MRIRAIERTWLITFTCKWGLGRIEVGIVRYPERDCHAETPSYF